jgi:hypothetical protein
MLVPFGQVAPVAPQHGAVASVHNGHSQDAGKVAEKRGVHVPVAGGRFNDAGQYPAVPVVHMGRVAPTHGQRDVDGVRVGRVAA